MPLFTRVLSLFVGSNIFVGGLVTNTKSSSKPRGTKPSLSFMNASGMPLLFSGAHH